MKTTTTVYKEVETIVSPEEVARNIIEELKYDDYALMDLVQNYTIEELPDFIYEEVEAYEPTEEEVDKVTEIILPELKELYNWQVKEFKKVELTQLSNRQNILEWLTGITSNASYDEPGDWLDPEEILNAILENGTKSGS